MPRERDIQAAIAEALRAEGYYVAKGSAQGNTGVPDLLVCARGRFIALEVKVDGADRTAKQKVHVRAVEAAGGAGFVVRSVADALVCVRSELSERYEV